MKLKDLINRCVPNKNGIDELMYLNIILILILLIVDIFINNIYLSLSLVAAIVILIFRFNSKNKKLRKKENIIFLKIIKWPYNKIKLYLNIIKNYNNSLYKRCPKCKQMLKLPLKKGKHEVKCPNCKKMFTVKCNRNEKVKVEIIK